MTAIDQLSEGIKSILDSHRPGVWSEEQVVPAAVLIPLFVKDGEVHVLLTVRTDKVEAHKGQISFPGGMREQRDRNSLETALRETEEEVGIRPQDVQVLGELDQLITVTNFVITPYVGIIPHPYDYRPSEAEIAELLEVPLSFFLDKANVRTEMRDFRGRTINLHFYDYGRHLIWGITAKILTGFLELLEEGNGKLPAGFPRVS